MTRRNLIKVKLKKCLVNENLLPTFFLLPRRYYCAQDFLFSIFFLYEVGRRKEIGMTPANERKGTLT